MIQTLAELDDELVLLLHHLESDSLEDLTMADQLLDELLPQLDKKIDGYMGAISHYGDKIANIDREMARLQARKESEQDKQMYLKSNLQQWLELRSEQLGDKGKRVEGNLYKVSLVANGGKLPLELNKEIPIESVPDKFTVTVQTTKFDPDKVRDFMTDNNLDTILTPTGETIATLLPRGKHLRIS